MRKRRKVEHIENYLKTEYIGDPLFDDVYIEHDALPEIDLDEVDTGLEFLGKRLDFPLMINAITGGTDQAEEINEILAIIAKKYGLAMAVGSQKIALEDESCCQSFSVVRDTLGKALPVLGNLGMDSGLEDAIKAVDMLSADGLQIHLNCAQELAMPEGDRSFKGVEKRIGEIRDGLKVPLIVKETGYGISKRVAKKLQNLGVEYIDLSGSGGTNFIEIEDMRSPENDFSELYYWGIPTAKSILDVREAYDGTIIASGGIRSSLDIIKSLALGADMVAMSGEILKFVMHGGCEYAMKFMDSLIYKTKMIMVLTSCKNIEDVKKLDYKITGKLKELIET